MEGIMPATTTATELQRNYKKVKTKAKKLKKPLIVLSNNKPDGVFMDYDVYESEYKKVGKQSKKSGIEAVFGSWTNEEADEFDRIIEDAFEKVEPLKSK